MKIIFGAAFVSCGTLPWSDCWVVHVTNHSSDDWCDNFISQDYSYDLRHHLRPFPISHADDMHNRYFFSRSAFIYSHINIYVRFIIHSECINKALCNLAMAASAFAFGWLRQAARIALAILLLPYRPEHHLKLAPLQIAGSSFHVDAIEDFHWKKNHIERGENAFLNLSLYEMKVERWKQLLAAIFIRKQIPTDDFGKVHFILTWL